MEIHLLPFSFTTFLLFTSFLFLLVKGWKKSKSLNKNKKFPPSPAWKLPLIGHLHLIMGVPPHRALSKLSKQYGPIIHLKLGEVSSIVISSREIAKKVLTVNDLAIADRPESIGMETLWYDYKDLAFSPYNEHWKQMRKICIMEILSNKNVRSYGHIRHDEISKLVRSIRSHGGEPFNVTDNLLSYTSSVTARAAFGGILKEQDTLINFMKIGVALAGGFELADLYPSLKFLQIFSWNKYQLLKMRRKLDSILDVMLNEHKDKLAREKRDNGELVSENIVDVLLRKQQSEDLDVPITDDNIKAIIFDMFTAGSETSSTTFNWLMTELMRNPQVTAKAQAEIREAFKGKKTIEESDIQKLKYLKLVIKENLRVHPAVTILPRACREECEVDGYTIPYKAKVAVNIWALGRDPQYWEEPETFKPERFENSSLDFLGNNYEYIPFGAGSRFCPGMNFGLANIEVPLAQLLYHFDWKLPHGMNSDDLDMSEMPGVSVQRKNKLYVIATPYNPPIEG
ncbi:premnaspirodiene oxygenase-like [Olea europaea subsp. europaea]|uniref:Premnaspirodiene oxygenase-like n=1 Tax=Olea europaea subsp. europaea TaxID=158383 RepID=A0A8S0Q3B3_OLEEU|nr:premnaspirodiene oxygenase-like [Olea europaea subsp. europaea]